MRAAPDRDHRLASSNREKFFGPLGVTDVRGFVDPTNPTHVGILMDVPDIDALVSALQTSEAAKAEEEDGVLAETIVMLVQA